MAEQNFLEMIKPHWRDRKFLCVGLDPSADIPDVFGFNTKIIGTTHKHVCAYKLNLAHYLRNWSLGVKALEETVDDLLTSHPEIPIILDSKFGDVVHTNEECLTGLKQLGVHAVTINPYPGEKNLQPFLDSLDIFTFVVCRMSGEGTEEFQDEILERTKQPFHLFVAEQVIRSWNHNGNCGLVIAANFPDTIRNVRERSQHIPLLIPGSITQGGNIKEVVRAQRNLDQDGFIISISRAITEAHRGPSSAEIAGMKTLQYSYEIKEALHGVE